jgi:hypothetical protein
VTSRWVCTWAVAVPEAAHSASVPAAKAAKANLIDMKDSSIAGL